jgi:hypothetical protein
MIKGVNKQIVEINYTKDDYVEKAILIINPEKSGLPKALLNEKARSFMIGILPETKRMPAKKRKNHWAFWVSALSTLACFGASLLIWLL